MKLYRCKYCKERVSVERLKVQMPYVCDNADCIRAYFEEYKDKILSRAKKEVKRRKVQEDKEVREKLKTHSDWLKELQKIFNAYIRERDRDLPCISCGQFAEHYDAGHYYSVGRYPELRFDEDNCHKQCVACNQHLRGALVEYVIALPKRIGQERFDALVARRNVPKNYTVSEIKELIEEYKSRLKELKIEK